MFVHGVAVNGDLWRRVVPGLAGGYRCITPDLPWGSHSIPLNPHTDLSLPGMARIVADFLDALDVDDVTIVANDTGGAVAQALVGATPTGSSPRAHLMRRVREVPADATEVPGGDGPFAGC